MSPAERDTRIENTLGDPVEFLYTEHASIVDWCHRLATLADDPTADDAPRLAASLLDFLNETLPLHIADEEEELFPRLKRRAPHDERLMSVIEQLQMEHRETLSKVRLSTTPWKAWRLGAQYRNPRSSPHSYEFSR